MPKSIKFRFTKTFQKEISQLSWTQAHQLKKRLELFQANPNHQLLKKHKLHGKMKGFYTINITGDLRAVYWILEKNKDELTIGFTRLGTHSQLY